MPSSGPPLQTRPIQGMMGLEGHQAARVENGDWLQAAADVKPATERHWLGACPIFPRPSSKTLSPKDLLMSGNILCIIVLLTGAPAEEAPSVDRSFERHITVHPELFDRSSPGDPLIPSPSLPISLTGLPQSNAPLSNDPADQTPSLPEAHRANYRQVSPGASPSPSDGLRNEANNIPEPKQPEPKPWLPLILALLLALGSLLGNAYLLWIAVGFRNRYRKLVGQVTDLVMPA